MSELGQLAESNANACDQQHLKATFRQQGYLFIRRLIDPARVHRLKRDILGVFRENRVIERGDSDDPLWSGGPAPTETEWMRCYDKIVRLESFQNLAEAPEIVRLMNDLWGGPVRVWKQRLIRAVFPNPEGVAPVGLGAHQDGNPRFAYQAERFCTCWVPLMKINPTIGGLAVVPGSHTGGLLDHAGNLASSASAALKKEFSLSIKDAQWLTAEFEPGDAVVFTNYTVHRGLPNVSDQIRLSCDFRYQPVGDSASWLADALGPEIRRVAQQIDEIVASRALYVATHATASVLDEVRRKMLEERSTSMERAQALTIDIQRQQAV